ncbi:MFS family permease [Parvibaculum sp. MBR-TMA-1.3b-4.2]|jgi:MFS family permease
MTTSPTDDSTVPAPMPTLGQLMRNRDLVFYLSGRFAATLAMLIQSVAVGWQIYDLTGSALALGFVGLAQFLPMVVLTLPAGDIADRVDRRLIVGAATLTEAASAGALIWLTVTGATTPGYFYAVLVAFGCARAVMAPAARSFVPMLVTAHELPRAIAVSSSTFQVAVIAGPALGGAIYIFGPAAAYGTCAVLFALSCLTFSLIRKPQAAEEQQGPAISGIERVMAGIAFMRRTPIVLGAISLDLFAVLLGGAVALLPVFAKDILHVGPEGLGLMRSGPAIGALLVNFLIIWKPPSRHTGLWMFGCIGLFGVATIVFGLSTHFLLSLGALVAMGGADMVSVYVRSTIIPLATPRVMLGRVSAVEMLFIGGSNELGEFESGVTAAWFGTVPAVIIGGLGTLGVVGLWMWLFPDLRKVDRLEDVKPPAQ